jgi:hypothetical protein
VRLPTKARHKIFALMLGITLTLPDLVFGASRSFSRSGKFGAPKIHRQHFFSHPSHRFGFSGVTGNGPFRRFGAPKMHRQHFFSHPFFPFGFAAVDGFGDREVIIIQNSPPASAFESRQPVINRIYVPPRWTDGGYGVQVLQPGYWTDPKQAAER